MVVEKLTELGVDRLVWLETARGEGKPPRADRSQAWTRAALEQSRGAWLMDIQASGRPEGPWPVTSRIVVCDQSGEPARSALVGDQPILGLVGPEGGFTRDERPELATSVSLAQQVLRVETAAIALAAIVRAP
jgi:RsmE family RNA methyltransferase